MEKNISQKENGGKAIYWFAVGLKTWIPVIVVLVSIISFFVYLGAKVEVLDARADVLEEKTKEIDNLLSELRSVTARIDERTVQIQNDVNFIKQTLR